MTSQESEQIQECKRLYAEAEAAGDSLGMYKAHQKAEKIRHKSAGLVVVIEIPEGGEDFGA